MDAADWALADRAVSYWVLKMNRGRIAGFDVEDARQEAALGIWLSKTKSAGVGYRRIIDAVRRLTPGYRYSGALQPSELVDYDGNVRDVPDALPGPDRRLEVKQALLASPGLLNDRQMHVLIGVLRGASLAELSVELSLSPSRTSQLLAEVTEALHRFHATPSRGTARREPAPAPAVTFDETRLADEARQASELYAQAMR